MRSSGIVGVLCLVAAPTFASPVLFTFSVTSGNLVLNLHGQSSTQCTMGGTFAATVYHNDGHLGASDTFILENAGLMNTSAIQYGLSGLATANIGVGKARFLDFAPVGPGHVAGNGVPAAVGTDVYAEVTVTLTGLINSPMSTKTWANSTLPFNVSFNTSVTEGSVVVSTLSAAFSNAVGIPDISMTLTLDLILNIQGTALWTPEPTLGGLTALGVGGAGAWLRRRRR